MMFFLGLWTKFQSWIIGAGAILLALLAIILKAFLAGKASERAKQQADSLKAYQQRNKIDAETETLPDDKLDADLRKYQRMPDKRK